MKKPRHAIACLVAFSLFLASLGLTGCASLAEEDPNSQETPWAAPAGWEGRVPGMPNQGF